MRTTRYFEEQVRRKRPYLTMEMGWSVLADPLRLEVQEDGRVRHWGRLSRRMNLAGGLWVNAENARDRRRSQRHVPKVC